MFQADDRIGISFWSATKVTEDGNCETVDPFAWEVYYSFKANDSVNCYSWYFWWN